MMGDRSLESGHPPPHHPAKTTHNGEEEEANSRRESGIKVLLVRGVQGVTKHDK